MTKITAYLYGVVGGYWIAAGYPPEGVALYIAGVVTLAMMILGYYIEVQERN
jgi:uncharacterized protein YneF (UPF0154 family)